MFFLPPNQIICQGQSAIITPTFLLGSSQTYTLLPGNIISNNNFTLNPNSSTNYTILASSINTIKGANYSGNGNYYLTVFMCTDIKYKITQNEFSIYPKPFTDIITINNDVIEKEITIYSSLGQKISSFLSSEKVIKINTIEFIPSIYFIQVKCDDKTFLQKLIKG